MDERIDGLRFIVFWTDIWLDEEMFEQIIFQWINFQELECMDLTMCGLLEEWSLISEVEGAQNIVLEDKKLRKFHLKV